MQQFGASMFHMDAFSQFRIDVNWVKWKMSAPYITLSSQPSTCQKLLKLVKIWQSYDKNNFDFFSEARCIDITGWTKNIPICFCQDFVKSQPNWIIFGEQMAKTIELCAPVSYA